MYLSVSAQKIIISCLFCNENYIMILIALSADCFFQTTFSALMSLRYCKRTCIWFNVNLKNKSSFWFPSYSRCRVTEDANCQRPPCTVIYMNKWLVLYDLGWQLWWTRFLLQSLEKKCLIYCTTCFNNNIFFKAVSEQ